MKPAIELFLLTSVSCNVRCKSCLTGRREPAVAGIMSLEMMDRILAKATKEANVLLVQLYFLNEPFLIPHMPDMIRACQRYHLRNIVSTNGNSWKHGPAIMAAAPDTLIVSLSGWTQAVYERSHAGGDIERVKQNMREIARLRDPRTHIQVSWHRYKYNEHEESKMQAYAESLGFSFFAYATSILPQRLAFDTWRTGVEPKGSEDLLMPVGKAKDACYKRRHWDCAGQDRIVGVDSRGILMHCNCDSYGPHNERGDLFKTTIPEFIAKRQVDPVCVACKAVGAHVYGMQAWSRPQWSPTRLLGTLFRKLKLDGYVEPMVRSFYGRYLLPMPKRPKTPLVKLPVPLKVAGQDEPDFMAKGKGVVDCGDWSEGNKQTVAKLEDYFKKTGSSKVGKIE